MFQFIFSFSQNYLFHFIYYNSLFFILSFQIKKFQEYCRGKASLHHHLTITSPSPHYHFTITPPSFHHHPTITSPSFHHHPTITSPSFHHHLTITPLSPHHHLTITSPSPHYYFTITPLLLHHHPTFTSPSPHYHSTITSATADPPEEQGPVHPVHQVGQDRRPGSVPTDPLRHP